jgi:crotonobetainyl-CoA:carnitine CoA-transferase CaiB-like acyl-CoA transferase
VTAGVGKDDALALLAKGVPVSMVRPVDQVLEDPQAAERGMIQDLDGFRMLGIPVKLGRTPGSVRTPPATRGEDTAAVLAEQGWPESEIDRLIGQSAVYQADRGEDGTGTSF